jgi:hypothetical protein
MTLQLLYNTSARNLGLRVDGSDFSKASGSARHTLGRPRTIGWKSEGLGRWKFGAAWCGSLSESLVCTVHPGQSATNPPLIRMLASGGPLEERSLIEQMNCQPNASEIRTPGPKMARHPGVVPFSEVSDR